MATIVNNPGETSSSNGMWFFLAVLVLVIGGIIFFYYMFPQITNLTKSSSQSNQNSVPAISIPDKVDVNINKDAQQ